MKLQNKSPHEKNVQECIASGNTNAVPQSFLAGFKKNPIRCKTNGMIK